MLQATGGTSKGSLGLWWSIWQKLLGKPRRGFSIVHHVCWRFWANMRCYQWEQWISFLVAISQIQPPKWSWMYWSCLSIRSCRSQWWQQCWLGDRLHEIGGTWLWHSYGNLAYQVHLNTIFDELDSDGRNVLFGYVWLVCPFKKGKEGGVMQRCSSTKAISSGSKDICAE